MRAGRTTRPPSPLPAGQEKGPARSTTRAAFVQPKLAISEPDDAYEREADRVADEVMRTPDLQAAPPRVQRMCSACEEEVQRKAGENGGEHSSELESYIGSLSGRGEPLGAQALAFFEPRFGVDLSGVRVHRDVQADRSARSIDALAYTAGEHIVFRAGRYDASTQEGRHLLAHELTHVVQQGGVEVVRRAPRKPPSGPELFGEEPTLTNPIVKSGVEIYQGNGFTRIGSDEVVIQASMEATPASGFYDVYVHGAVLESADGEIHAFFAANGWVVDTSVIADAVTSNPTWKGQPIRLVMCWAGKGPNPPAARLGMKLSVSTMGVNHKLYVEGSDLVIDPQGKVVRFPWPPPQPAAAKSPSAGVPEPPEGAVPIPKPSGAMAGAEEVGSLTAGARASFAVSFLGEMANVAAVAFAAFEAMAQGREKLRSEAYMDGFARAIAARLLGFTREETLEMLRVYGVSRDVVREFTATTGIPERANNLGVRDGWNFVGRLTDEQRRALLRAGFAMMKQRRQTIASPNFGQRDVERLGAALVRVFELARQAEEEARREAEARRWIDISWGLGP